MFLNGRISPTETSANLAVELDGFLFNKTQLNRQLGLPDTADDVACIRSAYLEWGDGFAARLEGEYVVVIKDPSRKCGLIVRDRLGIRPIYYTVQNGSLFYATHTVDLFSNRELNRRPNIEAILCLFFEDWSNLSSSFFENVFRLPAGHCLRFTEGGVTTDRYWKFEPQSILYYTDERQYTEQYLSLFQEALKKRIRGHKRVGALLSPGLDSSSVTSTASRLLGSTELHSFSFKFRDPMASDDGLLDILKNENRWIFHQFEPEDNPALLEMDFEEPDLPYQPWNSAMRPVFETMKGLNIDLAFTGDGADDLLTPAGSHYADLALQGRLRTLHAQMKRNGDIGITNLECLRTFVFAPMIPPNLIKTIRWAFPKAGPEWINQDMLRKYSVMERGLQVHRRSRPKGQSFRVYSRMSRIFVMGATVRGWEHAAALARRWGFRFSFPLLDLSLIDFAFRLPQEQLCWDGQEKKLLRNAMRGILPEVVRTKPKFQNFSACTEQGILRQQSLLESWFENSRLVDMNVVQPEAFRRHWRYCQGSRNYSEILRITFLEKWLRTF